MSQIGALLGCCWGQRDEMDKKTMRVLVPHGIPNGRGTCNQLNGKQEQVCAAQREGAQD